MTAFLGYVSSFARSYLAPSKVSSTRIVYSLKWFNFSSNLLSYVLSFAIPPCPSGKSGAELEDIKLNHVPKGNDNSSLQRLESLKPVKLYKNLHLVDTQLQIKEDNRNKSAIYCIFNIVNGKKYIGSASTNRINTRFRNHCIHGTGSNLLKKAIDKYGLHNFYFIILEYYPGLVLKENLKKAHLGLLKLENHYLSFLSPEYNLLTDATSSTGFKHSDYTKLNMKEKYSDERKAFIGQLNGRERGRRQGRQK